MAKYIKTLLVLIALLTIGCSTTTKTHLGQLPVDSHEFEKPMGDIEREYPEVTKYIGAFKCGILGEKCEYFGSIYDMPPMSELINIWGEPEEITGAMWNLYPTNAAGLHPTKTYIWYKGNYRIEAVADKPLVFKWEPHLWYWNWYLHETINNEEILKSKDK